MADEMKTVVTNENETVDSERKVEPRDTYIGNSGTITKPSHYSFVVKSGYRYFKVWVKALSNSSEIAFTIKQGSATGTTIASYSVLKGTSLSKILEASTIGTYTISFNSSGNMNGQFNIRVGDNFNELNRLVKRKSMKRLMVSRAYEPVGGSIKNTYSFTVQRGYSFVKVWVKALSNSSDIDFTIKQGSVTGTTIASYSVLKGTSLSKIFEAPTVGTYIICFNASGSMKGQFSVKVGTDFSELNS